MVAPTAKLSSEREEQKGTVAPCVSKFVQHAYATEEISGVYRQAEDEGGDGIKKPREHDDSRVLGAAAVGDYAHKGGPERAVAPGLHKYAVGHAEDEVARQYRHCVGKGGFYDIPPVFSDFRGFHSASPFLLRCG